MLEGTSFSTGKDVFRINMEIRTSLYDKLTEDTAVTVGKFDGLHKGHEFLTRKLLQQEEKGLKSLVLTFDVSPRIHLKKDLEKQLITNEERVELLRKENISYLAQCPFEKEIMPLEPDRFIELLVENYNMKYMVCGTDFRFGKMGKGDVTLLGKLAPKYDFTLEVVEKLKCENREISSTFVREEIALGNIAMGNELLGYSYYIWGKVVHGNHLGRKIGIPTVNLIPPEDKLLPRNGVYITEVEVDGKMYNGVTNVGVKPTIEGEYKVGVETHILDFKKNIYGEYVRVIFLERIREEIQFSSIDELCEQMQRDKQTAIDYFS